MYLGNMWKHNQFYPIVIYCLEEKKYDFKINLTVALIINSFKLAIVRRFSRDANLSWINEVSCSTAGITWPLMDRRRTNQLFGFGRNIISITVTMLTNHCVVGRHAERMRLLFNEVLSSTINSTRGSIIAWTKKSDFKINLAIAAIIILLSAFKVVRK